MSNKIVYDFPDYTISNPWQQNTLGFSDDKITIIRQNTWPPPRHINILHLGWEDIFFRNAESDVQADQIAAVVANQISEIVQRGVKLVWTIRNLKSHSAQFEKAESRIRAALLANASVIVLMSNKHTQIVPDEFRNKVVIIPHYIVDINLLMHITTLGKQTSRVFRYGAPRNETDLQTYQSILNANSITKLISDPRLQREIDDGKNLMVKRRFNRMEELLFGAISSFSFFSRLPCLNSGVFNYYLGCRNVIFHSRESIKYLDIPSSFKTFELEKFTSIDQMIDADLTYQGQSEDEELDLFLKARDPQTIQKRWRDEIFGQI
jgi:hypothetical protein